MDNYSATVISSKPTQVNAIGIVMLLFLKQIPYQKLIIIHGQVGIFKIPRILSEFVIQIDSESKIRLNEPAYEIKRIENKYS